MLKNRSTIEVVLIAPALYLVLQVTPTSEGSGKMRIQAVSRCTIQCGTITFHHMMYT